MEQNEINIEKQELMERIKEKCCIDEITYKWLTIALAIASVVLFGVILMWGTLRNDIYIVAITLFLCATDYFAIKYSKIIQPITDAKELLHQYDKKERTNNYIGICFFVIIFSNLVFFRHDYLQAGILFGILAIVLLLIWIIGGYKNTDVERLRELVKQEDEKNEASV